MTITITDTTMASTTLPVWARYSPHAAADGKGAWLVSYLPASRLWTEDQAKTAMVLAEHVAQGHALSAHAEARAAELHLSVAEVVRYLEAAAQAYQTSARGAW